jgi:GxxExxY protein
MDDKINTDEPGEYKYKELTGLILKSAFEVHNSLGCGFLEKVYEKALIYGLREKGLKLETQKAIKIIYKGQDVGVYVADIVVEGKVIVELKVVNFLTDIYMAQALNYLRASGKDVALILNFAKPRLEYKRVVG